MAGRVAMKCPHCQQENVGQNGQSLPRRRRGVMLGLSPHVWQKRSVAAPGNNPTTGPQALLGGGGFRGIGRLLGVSPVAVMHWVKAQAQVPSASAPVRAAEVEWVACDELCAFIGKKRFLLVLVGY